MKILIVGAGIAGLALARALERRGIVPKLIERQAAWNGGGAGLFLPGNAARAFSELGLLPDIAEAAMPIRRQRILDPKGRVLQDIDTQAFWNTCGPCLALSWAAMHRILLNGLEKTSVDMPRSVSSVRSHAAGCDVTFDDGETERYDLVVGADGIRSRVRALVFPDAAPRYAGYVCWRFLADNTMGVDTWTAMIGSGQTLLVEPVGPSTIYVYGDLSVGLKEAAQYSANTDLSRLFSGFSAPFASAVWTPGPRPGVHFGHIETVPAGAWRRGRAVLIGDAAHASSPSMAQGAGLACEDALVLAGLLGRGGAIDEALDTFVKRRAARVAWVQKQCAVRDRLRTLPGFVSSLMFRHFGGGIYRRSYAPLLAAI